MSEIWKSVKDYEGLYEVSNMGNIRSLPKYHYKKSKILHPTLGKRTNRYSVMLSKDLKYKRLSVHRLVAQAFVENPDPEKYTEVNHKDENPQNNKASNLEWCDRWYNMHYRDLPKRIKRIKNPVRGISKTGEEIYFESMREADRNGYCIRMLEMIFDPNCKRQKGTFYKGYYWEKVNEHKQ